MASFGWLVAFIFGNKDRRSLGVSQLVPVMPVIAKETDLTGDRVLERAHPSKDQTLQLVIRVLAPDQGVEGFPIERHWTGMAKAEKILYSSLIFFSNMSVRSVVSRA